jgi:hypothetical protein
MCLDTSGFLQDSTMKKGEPEVFHEEIPEEILKRIFSPEAITK